jgi:hypothetical protein
MGIQLKVRGQLLARRKFEREILMLRWSVEEDRGRKVRLLLAFEEGRKMWNEDNKEGNWELEIKEDGIRKECMDWDWVLTSSLRNFRR